MRVVENGFMPTEIRQLKKKCFFFQEMRTHPFLKFSDKPKYSYKNMESVMKLSAFIEYHVYFVRM